MNMFWENLPIIVVVVFRSLTGYATHLYKQLTPREPQSLVVYAVAKQMCAMSDLNIEMERRLNWLMIVVWFLPEYT